MNPAFTITQDGAILHNAAGKFYIFESAEKALAEMVRHRILARKLHMPTSGLHVGKLGPSLAWENPAPRAAPETARPVLKLVFSR